MLYRLKLTIFTQKAAYKAEAHHVRLSCGYRNGKNPLANAIALAIFGKGLLSGSLVLGATIVGYFFGKRLFGS